MKFLTKDQLDKCEDLESQGCAKCKLHNNCKSPKMKVGGKGKLSTLIVSDYPGEQDDQIGRPFVGNANVDFLNLLRGKGHDPINDFWFINAINCRKSSKDGGTLAPSDSEIKCCRPYIERIIGELQPTNIILLGEYAVKSFFPFIEKANVDMFRGLSIPDQKTKAWIHTTISPRTIDSQSFNKNLASVYNRDLNIILKRLKNKFKEYKVPEIDRLYEAPKIIEELEYIIETQMPCYIDYETTGLKPYFNGHKIVSMSIASMIEYDKKDLPLTISFPLQYRDYFTPDEQNHIRYRIKKILASGIALSAHNIKFEDSWSRNIIKMRPKNWKFDTQIAAHILDNRKNFTGLKNQVYYNFGIRPYNEHIHSLLEQAEGSEFNRVDKIPLKDLLQYGGLDSAYGLMLEHIQREQIENRDLWGPYNFFHRGTLLMSNMQEKGICMDEEYYHAQKEILGIRIDELNNKLMTSKEARLFKRKEGREIDPASGNDLSLLFYEHMSEKKTYTKKGNLSVDKITLDKIDNPFVKDLLYLRKLEKTRGTYFSQFLREIYNGRMNPFFNLNIPVSYRSSSSGPNFQNIPTREEEIKKLVRSGVKASPGRQLLFWDGKGMEVGTSVCYHKDPNMIKYVTDPTTDMHRDTAADIWMLPASEVTGDIRFYAKNSWVFAQFYGSYYMDCGTTLWETCINTLNLKTASGVPLLAHLIDVGICKMDRTNNGNKTLFLEHCKEVERIFWKERFKVYNQWKWNINEEYQRNGYITSKMGFVFSGIMNRKQVSNYPIQGCLQGHSMVLTNKGYIPIKELLHTKVNVWTGFKWAEAQCRNMGQFQLAEIELSSGLIIHCDTRHKLKNEQNEWVDFKDLKVGTYIALPKLTKDFDEPFESYKMNWYFILGYILGDGCFISRDISEGFTRYVLEISGGIVKKPILEKMFQFFQNYPEFNPNWIEKPFDYKETKFIISLEGKKLTTFLGSFGYHPNMNAHTKRIPKPVWTYEKRDQMDFLKGLWLSDGARGQNQKGNLHMCNKELLQEVQVFSGMLGFDTNLVQTKDGWLLRNKDVTGSSYTSRKVPYSVLEKMLPKNFKTLKNWKDNEYILESRIVNNHQNPNQKVFDRMVQKYNPNFESYRYDTIKEIRVRDEFDYTYTMMVNDPLHQFVADGVIQKNTAFHLLLWSLIQIEDISIKEKWKSDLIAQIHDEGISDAVPEEIPHIIATAKHVTEVLMPKTFPWINVPFGIDISITPIDGNWYQKGDLK